jgi:hypothetical protein
MINLAQVAENLLQTLSKEEVNVLIAILQYYNVCNEDERVACLRGGCQTPRDAQLGAVPK